MDLKEFGRQLKEERLRQGLELADVMEKTKISRVSLEAIEEGNERALPHPVYAKGFVKNYARFLGMDADKMGNTMAQIYVADEDDPSEDQLVLTDARRLPAVKSRFAARLVILAVILALALAAGGVWFFWSPLQQLLFSESAPVSVETLSAPDVESFPAPADSTTKYDGAEHAPEGVPSMTPRDGRLHEAPSPLAAPLSDDPASVLDPVDSPDPFADLSRQTEVSDDAEPDAEAARESSTATQAGDQPEGPVAPFPESGDAQQTAQGERIAAQQEEPAATGRERTLEIRAFQNCWLSAQADHGRVREAFLRTDERLVVSFEKTLELKLGNAGGVDLYLDGRPWPMQAKAGEVMVLRFP